MVGDGSICVLGSKTEEGMSMRAKGAYALSFMDNFLKLSQHLCMYPIYQNLSHMAS